MVINYNLINVATNNAFIVMRSSGKRDRKTDFLERLSFQLAQPYVKNRKLRGKTKVLAEKIGFIDDASNTINLTVQGIKREDVTDVGSILALHAWFVADAAQKITKKHILLKILNNLWLTTCLCIFAFEIEPLFVKILLYLN